jgi:hypothetical protein
MAGLNIRLSKDGTQLFLKNKQKFLGNIKLNEQNFKIDRVYNIKEIEADGLVKFEADVVGSEIVAMSTSGILKVSEKNMVYRMSTMSKKILKFLLTKFL